MKRKILYITLFIVAIIQIQAFSITIPDDYITQLKYNNPIGNNYEGIHTFENPVNVKTFYLNVNRNSLETLYIRFYDSKGNILLSKSLETANSNRLFQTNLNDVKTIRYECLWSAITTYNIYDYEVAPLELKESIFDKDIQAVKYIFNKTVNVLKSDIIFKDSLNNDIPFDYYIESNNLIIKPINRITTGEYRVKLNKISANDYFGDENLINLEFSFTIEESLQFLNTVFDKIIETITMTFNKNVAVAKEDIAIHDSNGNLIDFDYIVQNNLLKISPIGLIGGKYNLTVKQVTNIDGNEIIAVPNYNFIVSENLINLISNDFGNYVLKDKSSFNFTFDNKIDDADLEFMDNDDNPISYQLIINGNKLSLILDNSLDEDTIYKIKINSLNNSNLYKLKSPLYFEFTTKSITGNPSFDTILNEFLNIFVQAKNRGILIVILAISIGVIFIIAKWLWNKLKIWLRKV